jgi:hypothetical protein
MLPAFPALRQFFCYPAHWTFLSVGGQSSEASLREASHIGVLAVFGFMPASKTKTIRLGCAAGFRDCVMYQHEIRLHGVYDTTIKVNFIRGAMQAAQA